MKNHSLYRTRARSPMTHKGGRGTLAEAYAHALAVLSSRPDITGIDIGPKYVAGKKTRKQAIRVHVKKKLRASRLSKGARIPDSFLGVPSDVVVCDYRRYGRTPLSPSGRFDPIRPGISVGNPKAEAGTIGLIVFDDVTGAACLLSAFHVLAGPNAVAGDAITQPATADHGSTRRDTIARLFRFYRPGTWGDAAVARLILGRRSFTKEIFGSDIVIDAVGIPSMGLRVAKCGRGTGLTKGRIEGVGKYFYTELPGGVTGFRVVPEPDDSKQHEFCAAGDSGAVYYELGTTTGIGLHCAGGTDPSVGAVGIACSLATVLATLRVSLEGPSG